MKTVLFHNPSAGAEDHSVQALSGLLSRCGLEVQAFDAKGEALEAGLRQAAEASVGLVLVAGGDGTVGRVAARLASDGPPVAILPLGTANNLARATGSWGSAAGFAAGWRRAQRRPLDLAWAEGGWGRRRFLESVGFGAFARAVRQANASGVEGLAQGRATFREALLAAQPRAAVLRLEGQCWEAEYLSVEVMNIAMVGPNLPLAPESDPGDGLLDLVLLPAERREAMLRWIEAPEAGPAPVERHLGREITVSWPGRDVRLDDQAQRHDSGSAVRFCGGVAPLTLLVPEQTGLAEAGAAPDTLAAERAA